VTRRPGGGLALLALAAAASAAGCTRLVASYIDDGPWLVRQTEHFTFRYRPVSYAVSAMPQLSDEAEAGYAQVCQRLEVSFDGVVLYYLYNPDEADEIGVQGGFAYPEFMTIRQTYAGGPFGTHELVHVLADRTIGVMGSNLMDEGLAVALDGRYRGRPIAEWMAGYVAAGDVIAIDDLLFHPDRYPESRFYPQSGSFVRYLLERFGPAGVKRVFTVVPDDYRAAFTAAFGVDLDTVWGEYRTSLGA
jgi:hypothetical protein